MRYGSSLLWSHHKRSLYSPLYPHLTFLKAAATDEDAVENLLNYISKGPVWRFHSLLRALHLTDQDHVIKVLGLRAEDCLFVCGISLTSSQLVSELFPDCTRSCFSQVVLRRRGGGCIYEMRCLFVAVGPNARFIVLPHWDNMS